METAVITALITGACSVLAVILTNSQSNKAIDIKLDKTIAILEERITHLTTQVEKHNSIIERVYKLEGEVKEIKSHIK